MRLIILLSAALISLATPGLAATQSPYSQANVYFDVRDRAELVERFSQEDLQTDPARFAGKLVKVRGMVSSVAGSQTQTTLLIDAPGGAASTMIALPPDKRLSDFPMLDVGATIRVLCQVVTVAGSSGGSLELRVTVREYEAAHVDRLRAKEAAEKAASLVPERLGPRKLANRGNSGFTFVPDDRIARYSEAVRYYNSRITKAQCEQVASLIITEPEAGN